jgi:hypothetical protein
MESKRKYWSDILIALDAIDHHLASIHTYEQYAESITVKDAVERRLITIGEAVNKLMQLDPEDVIEHGDRMMPSYGRSSKIICFHSVNWRKRAPSFPPLFRPARLPGRKPCRG